MPIDALCIVLTDGERDGLLVIAADGLEDDVDVDIVLRHQREYLECSARRIVQIDDCYTRAVIITGNLHETNSFPY